MNTYNLVLAMTAVRTIVHDTMRILLNGVTEFNRNIYSPFPHSYFLIKLLKAFKNLFGCFELPIVALSESLWEEKASKYLLNNQKLMGPINQPILHVARPNYELWCVMA
jgi:hypothetical protein